MPTTTTNSTLEPVPFSVCTGSAFNSIAWGSTSCDIPAGRDNAIADASTDATIAGGMNNALVGTNSAVGGGVSNSADGDFAVVGGGSRGLAKGAFIAHAGGQNNKVWSNYAAGAGGFKNTVAGRFSVVVGSTNTVRGHHSLAVGSSTDTPADFAAGFGFGTLPCFVPYQSSVRLCGSQLFLNGEELDIDAFTRRGRRVLRGDDDVKADGSAAEVRALKGLVDRLQHQLTGLSARLAAALAWHQQKLR